ncbi:hypothetical protein E1180_17195 [Roseibium denhamense]|uniref:Localization factor PodJL n=1 Tax=Roseibium denhamense TaxID=76305 RepID=A0ABY1P5L2_9HYPH|nr:peptidoglycan-binding protein [Roseibium denhamense]MTI07242.1 hypothetical protein [Roseibium denhamense]SMP26280.1 localization factor PodJL [Roseibium denhamense]
MPAWKKNEAGRRSRDAYGTQEYQDAPRREPARTRIERLTRTATALGASDPYGVPHEAHDEDLNAVADELDRLLSERGDRSAQSKSRPARKQRPSRQRPDARSSGLDDVMGALDRLDEQVRGLAEPAYYEDEYPEERRGSRAGTYAIDNLPPEDSYEDEYDDYYDDRDDDHYAHARSGKDVRRGNGPQRDASMHMYRDLGRRIDALRGPQEQALAHVRTELGSLRDALGGLAKGTSDTVGRQNAELRRLADMVERLRSDKKNDQLAKEIRKEVTELKSMVGRTNVEGALQTLEHGYAHILQRLDELSRASVDPRVLRGVTMRLNEIEDAFAALPRSEHMVVLEDRVISIAERMEELLQHKNHADIEPLRAELKDVRSFVEQIDIKGLVEGIDDRMKFVSSRLDDLEVLAREQRGLDSRLSAMEERMPEPETISRLQGRLEDIVGMMADDRASPADSQHLGQVDRRLNEIADRLERMEQAEPLPAGDSKAFEALEKRLETISGKIDAIEKRSARPVPVLDAANMRAGNGPDTQFMSQLQERLNDLTTRLDGPKDGVTTADLDKLRAEIGQMRASVEPASTDALEKRISDLAQIVSKGGDDADDGRLDQLSQKVAALADQIQSTSSKALSFDQFAPILERIETGMQRTRNDVADIAKKAAVEAVSKAPAQKNTQYDDAISSLQGDLKRLLDAAEGSDERTRNTFDSVKNVLGSINQRLDHLEKADIRPPEAESRAQPVAASAFSPIKVQEPAPLFSNSPKPAAQDKPAEQEAAAEAAPSAAPADPQDRARDRKADFIAAARRAAQAASAEAAHLEKSRKPDPAGDDANEERGKARIGWLRNVLKRDKSEAPDSAQPEPETEEALDLSGMEDSATRYPEDEAAVLPGDRPAPDADQAGSGGRRRAIMYAAAAVVLLLGTLTVYRFATDGGEPGQPVASAPEGTVTTEEPAAVAALSDTPAVSAADDQLSPETPVGQDPEMADAAGSAPPAGSEEAGAAVAANPETASANQPDEDAVAFAPPVGVDNGFTNDPVAPANGFTASGEGAPVSPANLIASLPPEEIGTMALRSAAASGDPAAEFMVGVKYTEGDGVPADLSKAAVWYQKAAGKGLAPAQYRLASLYEKGRGVEKDVPKAKAWYTQAAEAGNAKAMHNLAVIHAEGGGGQPDYAAAAKWFEEAANYGVKDSLFNLGILYAGGIGVDKDLVASYKWFAIAADQGDPEAAKRRDDVANMMDEETLASARLAVENFALKTPIPAANKVTTQPDWAETPATPAASQASAPSAETTDMIRQAQEKLNYLGFDTGSPDGQMGPRTRSAIRAFQRSLGLPETGTVDRRLIEELNSQAI